MEHEKFTLEWLKSMYKQVFNERVYVIQDFGFFDDVCEEFKTCFRCGGVLKTSGNEPFAMVCRESTSEILACFCEKCVDLFH